MRMDDFEGQYAHGFSIALDPVFCCVGLKEPSAVGFRIVSDTLLFYRMVQAHFRQLRFWAWYGSTSGHASFEFREDDTDKSPALPKQTAKDGAPEVLNQRLGTFTRNSRVKA
jgi:hypothetical protein